MSFVKLPSHARKASSSKDVSRTSGERRRRPKKPQWDSTVNDLSVYKASPDEIARRKAAHLSQNMDLVDAEKIKKKLHKANKGKRTPGSEKKKRQNAFLREILHNQSQIEDALATSDKVMAVVKDLFGDDPKKFRGLPNVTVAPNQTGISLDNSRLPDGRFPNDPSKLDILSDSLMDKTALNDLENEYTTESDEEPEGPLGYQPVLDMNRFHRLLVNAEKEEDKKKGHVRTLMTHSMAERALQKTLDQMTTVKEGDVPSMPDNPDGSYLASPAVTRGPDSGAINDTQKVQRSMARTEPERSPDMEQDLPPSHTSAADLHTVLEGLEANIADYELATGRPRSDVTRQNTFSGYTLALVQAVSKLSGYLKESELQLRAEMTVRQQLSQDVGQLKALVDALTSDIILTQEDLAKVEGDYTRYKIYTEQQLSTIRQTLTARGIDVPPVLPLPKPAFAVPPPMDSASVQGPAYQHGMAEESTPWMPQLVTRGPVTTMAGAIASYPATLLSPPKQADSPKVTGGRHIGHPHDMRQSLRFGAPQNVQQIIQLQQLQQQQRQMMQEQQEQKEMMQEQQQQQVNLQNQQQQKEMMQEQQQQQVNLQNQQRHQAALQQHQQQRPVPREDETGIEHASPQSSTLQSQPLPNQPARPAVHTHPAPDADQWFPGPPREGASVEDTVTTNLHYKLQQINQRDNASPGAAVPTSTGLPQPMTAWEHHPAQFTGPHAVKVTAPGPTGLPKPFPVGGFTQRGPVRPSYGGDAPVLPAPGQGAAAQPRADNHSALQQKLAALSLQHSEAQQKLQELMQQTMEGGHHQVATQQKAGSVRDGAVSPSISPIPHDQDDGSPTAPSAPTPLFGPSGTTTQEARPGSRVIRISLPRVDITSLTPANAVPANAPRAPPVQPPVQGLPGSQATLQTQLPVRANGARVASRNAGPSDCGWFALSSHVTAS